MNDMNAINLLDHDTSREIPCVECTYCQHLNPLCQVKCLDCGEALPSAE